VVEYEYDSVGRVSRKLVREIMKMCMKDTNASSVRGNLWYDGRGRVWQRWNDNSSTEDWDGTLLRFVYDGSTLAQEHNFDVAEVLNAWVYTYDDLTRDYLRQPGGTRQRERTTGTDTDYYLQANQGTLEYKVERSPVSETYARTERKSSLDQLPDSTFTNISNLATSNGYIEMYGGSTSGSTAGFDGLVQMGGQHYLAGLGRYTSRMGNNAYIGPSTTRNLTSIMSADDHIPVLKCDKCSGPAGGNFNSSQCWYFTSPLPDNSGIICDEMLHDCTECDGIHCSEDIEHDYGWEHDGFTWKWDGQDPYFIIWPGYICNFDPDIRYALADVGLQILSCISDIVLAECIYRSLELSYGPIFTCNCDADGKNTYSAYTSCRAGICVNTSKIKANSGDQYRKYLAAILLHELVHWCLMCKYKRPSPQHGIAAASCMKACFEGYGTGLPGSFDEYGGGEHGFPHQWDEKSCSVCGADWENEPERPTGGGGGSW
jgi:hypothetical protein